MDIRHIIDYCSLSDFELFATKIQAVPQLLNYVPELLLLIKKLLIYQYLSEGSMQKAKDFYEMSFKEIKNLESFQTTSEIFQYLFSNANKRFTNLNFFKKIKKEFFGFFEEVLRSLLKQNQSVVLLKVNDCQIVFQPLNEKFNSYMYLVSEQELYDEMNDHLFVVNSIENLNIKNFFEETFKMQDNHMFDIFNNFNNKINTQNQIKTNFENINGKNTNINDEVCLMEENSKPIVIQYDMNDPCLNRNYLERKVVKAANKIKRYRTTNNFLKTFSPKFMKKENLDKKIIRRFKKFLKKVIVDQIHSDFKKRSRTTTERKNRNKRIENSSLDINPQLVFAYEFATRRFLPPFKSEKYAFKSFNTKFLLWLFSDPVIHAIYQDFGEEYSNKLSEIIINEYDLRKTEPTFCLQLPYYICNMSRLYQKEEKNEAQLSESIGELIKKSKISHDISELSEDSQTDLEYKKSRKNKNKKSFKEQRSNNNNIERQHSVDTNETNFKNLKVKNSEEIMTESQMKKKYFKIEKPKEENNLVSSELVDSSQKEYNNDGFFNQNYFEPKFPIENKENFLKNEADFNQYDQIMFESANNQNFNEFENTSNLGFSDALNNFKFNNKHDYEDMDFQVNDCFKTEFY